MTNSSEDHKTKKKRQLSSWEIFLIIIGVFFFLIGVYIFAKKALRARKHFKAGLHYITVTPKKKKKGLQKESANVSKLCSKKTTVRTHRLDLDTGK